MVDGISQITCADDMAQLAAEMLGRFESGKHYADLIAAVLMANHVADWYFENDLNTRLNLELMKATYPEWDSLRLIANGTKHCKPQRLPNGRPLEWEDHDFWLSPGHVGGDWIDWFIEFDGKQRSVYVLVRDFLRAFADSATRPK